MFEKFTVFYPKFNRFIIELSNIFYSLLKTFIIASTGLILALVLYVEVPRLVKGIAISESYDNGFLNIIAVVLLLSYISVKFLVLYTSQELREAITNKRWSLRVLLLSFIYIIGFTPVQEHQKIKQYQRASSWLFFAIFFVAFAGTTYDEIIKPEYQSVAWYTALYNVVVYGNISTVYRWGVSFVITWSLLVVSGLLAHHVAFVAAKNDELFSKRSKDIEKSREEAKYITPQELFKRYRLRGVDKYAFDDTIKFIDNEGIVDLYLNGILVEESVNITKPNERQRLRKYFTEFEVDTTTKEQGEE